MGNYVAFIAAGCAASLWSNVVTATPKLQKVIAPSIKVTNMAGSVLRGSPTSKKIAPIKTTSITKSRVMNIALTILPKRNTHDGNGVPFIRFKRPRSLEIQIPIEILVYKAITTDNVIIPGI